MQEGGRHRATLGDTQEEHLAIGISKSGVAGRGFGQGQKLAGSRLYASHLALGPLS